eukprot:5689164-Lingulodinium_polyedra.AAC.1
MPNWRWPSVENATPGKERLRVASLNLWANGLLLKWNISVEVMAATNAKDAARGHIRRTT